MKKEHHAKRKKRQFDEAMTAFTVAMLHGGQRLSFEDRSHMFFVILRHIEDRDRGERPYTDERRK